MSSPIEVTDGRAVRSRGRLARMSVLTRLAGTVAAGVAAGLLALFVLQAGILNVADPQKSALPQVVENPEQLSGTNAVITGHDSNRKPYEIRAAKGLQDKLVKTLVHLQDVSGRFERASGGNMDIASRTGRFDTATKKFELQGNVVISEKDRMRAVMESAEIDTNDQSLKSSGPVAVDMRGASIRANSLSVSANGTRVLFRGGVKARFVTNTSPTGEGG